MAHKSVSRKRKLSRVKNIKKESSFRRKPKIKKVKSDKSVKVKVDVEVISEAQDDSRDNTYSSNMLEQIMFKLPHVEKPLIGTPKEVQDELDGLAKKMQKSPGSRKNDKIFDKIHLYMHGYLVNVVLKKFPFIKGSQTVDIYQEALIALRFKSIPNFKEDRGMSFLNFSKMCIRRHLITLLNTANGRKKDQAINKAVSLDSSPLSHNGEDDENATYANIIGDSKEAVDTMFEKSEAFQITLNTLMNTLSDFEKVVLSEYLSSSSYEEISRNTSKKIRKRHDTKSVDNALLRIKKKAMNLKKLSKKESIPLFL